MSWPGVPPGVDPYDPNFDPGRLAPETANAWRQHRFHATWSVLLVVLVHILTLGMASPFVVARKYAFLPLIRPDDFSTAKAAGFLLIPFFAFYWVFIFCRRVVDRLALQARLRRLPDAPSRSVALVLAVGWVTSAVPYVGLLVWLPLQFALWPLYLVQIQRCCNRLALDAAPPEAHAPMLALERATRIRWIGWTILVPCLVMAAASVSVAVAVPTRPLAEMVVGIAVVLIVAVGAAGLLLLGMRGTPEHRMQLESLAPMILAGYLRIDKNAAWTAVCLALPVGCAFVGAGLVTLVAPASGTESQDGWPSVALGAALLGCAAYAFGRAWQLKQEIGRLSQLRPLAANGWAR